MKMTSAYANKMLKQLDDEKAYILAMEKSGSTFLAPSRQDQPDTDYDYQETSEKLSEIDDKIVKVKHAVNLSNVTSHIRIGDIEMTIDEVLVRMAQLNKRKNILDSMRKFKDGERQGRGFFDGAAAVPEYKYLAFSVKEVRDDYNRISREIMEMQLALDRHNQIDEFEVDI